MYKPIFVLDVIILNTTKVSRKEWALMIEKGLRKNEFINSRSRTEKFLKWINKHRNISIIIGLLAILVYLYVWGFKELFKSLVTYTIMITFFATFLAAITKKK